VNAKLRRLLVPSVDGLLAFALAITMLVALLSTEADIGYARDEGFYFQASGFYRGWFELLVEHPALALSSQGVERFWSVNHEHPALIKSLMAASGWLLHDRWALLPRLGTAERLPGMLLGSLSVAVVYLWGRRRYGRLGAAVAAVMLATMPRYFFHSHLACFDVPVASLWLVSLLTWSWALRRGGLWRALGFCLMFGLLLDTKHNAWLLPPLLLVHWLAVTAWGLTSRGSWRGTRWPLPWVLALWLSPLVLVALWPWLWFDTGARLQEWWRFHAEHVYYNMEFLGRTWWKPPMPRAYAWVMTAATVPAVTLLAAVLGLSVWARRLPRPLPWSQTWRALWAPRALVSWGSDGVSTSPSAGVTSARDALAFDGALWVIALVGSYAPWFLARTPIFGGTKHWLPAYPILALLAGLGVSVVARELGVWMARRRWPSASRWAGQAGLALCVLAAPIVMTAHVHPNGLSTYTPLVGGTPGAATLGLNRTFWGYTTGSLEPYLRTLRPGTRVYVHDTALQSWEMLRRDGRIPPGLRATLDIAESDVALYHHEPHMRRVEYQIWSDYGTVTPQAMVVLDGVPIAWAYERPARSRVPER